MADEDTGFEDVIGKITTLQQKANSALDRNTKAIEGFKRIFNPIGFQYGGGSHATAATEQAVLRTLQEQNNLLKQQLSKLEKIANQYNKSGDPNKYGSDPDSTGRGSVGVIFKELGRRIGKFFEPITRILSPILKSVWNIGKSVWGGLKKAGLLPGVFAGIGIAVGTVIAKVIQASPLLTAMMKMMNMGITLMLRPIGDFIGSVLRPMMVYFIKDVAVPFFQATKGLVRDGGKLGKGLLAFFIQPIESIGAAIIKALNTVLPEWLVPGGKEAVLGANMMFQDPARMFRQNKGIGEFTYGGGNRPSDTEWINMLQGTKVAGLGADDDVFTGSGEDIKWLMEERTKDPIMAQHYTTSRWKKLAEMREANFLKTGNIEGTSKPIAPPIGSDEGILGMFDDFGEWLKSIFDPLPEAAGDTGDALDGVTDSLGLFDGVFNDFLEGLGKGWVDFTAGIYQWANEVGAGFDKWRTEVNKGFNEWIVGLQKDYTEWEKAAGTWADGIWSTLMEFIGLGERANEQKEKSTENAKEADQSWLDTLWDMVTNWTLGGLEIKQAFAETEQDIKQAGDKIEAAAIVATGGLFKPDRPTKFDPKKDPSYPSQYGSPYDPNEALGGVYSAVTSQPSVTTSSPIMSSAQAAQASLALTGGQQGLGDIAGNRFESSPGKFVDIYKGHGENRVKISPTSEEGKRIQAIYQNQLDAKVQNAAQTSHTNKVRGFTTASEGQAYVMAGGGEAGIKAANIAKTQNLNLQSYEGLTKLGELTGITHPMVTAATTAVAQAVASGYSVGDGTTSSTQGIGFSGSQGAVGAGIGSVSSSVSFSGGTASRGATTSGGQGGARAGRSSGGTSSGGSSKGTGGGSAGGGNPTRSYVSVFRSLELFILSLKIVNSP